MNYLHQPTAEWLEADGLGGFASGTVDGRRSRRYHALLLTATTPPIGRYVLVSGFDSWVETPHGRFAISSQHYAPGIVHPDGSQRLESFEVDPWPTWTYRLEDGTRIKQELFVVHGTGQVCLRWQMIEGSSDATLVVRPFLAGRDYHSLHRENPAFRLEPTMSTGGLVWQPYDGVPEIHVQTNGQYRHDPLWYRNFLYAEEQTRGLECTEDLASPGEFRWTLRDDGDAVWILSASPTDDGPQAHGDPVALFQTMAASERRRRGSFLTPLDRAADAYLVQRGSGRTIIAGYPWFTDWGRDTFIALRGLCLATGRLMAARSILLDWSGHVSQGMLPNRFPDHGQEPEFNSVDASLWFIIAVHDFLAVCEESDFDLSPSDQRQFHKAVEAILDGYARGTRYGIRMDGDGLLAAGVPGVQLTWMDVKLGDWVVTPRIGKPVEVQALWLNSLRFASEFSPQWEPIFRRGLASFHAKFWNAADDCLYDVVDVDHQPGAVDRSFRPNQVLAIGGLPWPLVEGRQARRIVDSVEAHLWTPIGLRSLAPGEPGYRSRYEGGVWDRDSAYHQGTVWPWLIGPFAEAWVRVRGNTDAAKREASERFVRPVLAHLQEAGIGHISEIADADPPHTPRGCPFQAWSLGELLRLGRVLQAKRTAEEPHGETAFQETPTPCATT